MEWLNFSDPVFLVICAVFVVLIARELTPQAARDRALNHAETAEANLRTSAATENRKMLLSGWTVALLQQFGFYKKTKMLDTDEAVRAAQGLSEVHLGEIAGEDKLTLLAKKATDKYEDKRRAESEKRAGERAAQTAVRDESGSSTGQAGSPRDNKKAASRHRKS